LLVFTALDDALLRSEAKALGAIDYLIKSTSIQTLRERIRTILGGRPTKRPAAPSRNGKLARLLTPKQITVLEELVAGRSNKQIAVRLNISDDTVGSHMKEIFGRLGVRNRTEAVVCYIQLASHAHTRRRG
jgi:DNA-binding NarL/FixJ family response regulator